jgi:hypothetical protein
MSLKRRSVLLRVALLVLVPLLMLIGLFSYSVTTSVGSALTLIRSNVMMDDLARPVAGLQQALTRERAQMMAYGARPNPAARAALRGQEQATDRAITTRVLPCCSSKVTVVTAPASPPSSFVQTRREGGITSTYRPKNVMGLEASLPNTKR